jgi:hypothetical protein
MVMEVTLYQQGVSGPAGGNKFEYVKMEVKRWQIVQTNLTEDFLRTAIHEFPDNDTSI